MALPRSGFPSRPKIRATLDRRGAREIRSICLAFLLASCGDAGAEEKAEGGGGSAGGRAAARRTASAPGTIAYVGANGRELRIINPDGSGGRSVWRLPDTLHTITAPAWRPDGTEIAFASNHEMAVSIYERDVYAVGPDGSGVRRLTNPPARAELASRPKGTVTVTVQNLTFDGGPYFVYVMGAPQPLQELIPGAGTKRLTFRGVADLGEGVPQPVVVINGIMRWWDAAVAADVEPGRSVDAGTLALTANPIEHYGADGPFWRADGSRVGYLLGPTCLLNQVPAEPKPGPSYEPLLDPGAFGPVCAVDWAPSVEMADQLLALDMRDFTESGQSHVLRVREGSRERPAPVATFDRYTLVADMRWLPDGSGFVVARQDDLTDEDVNLYEYRFDTRQPRKITDFTGEFTRRISVSPDGASIAFERARGGSLQELATLPSDIWVIGRDGTDLRPLVRDAAYPAWNPQR